MADKITVNDVDNYIDDLYKLRQNSILTDGEYGKGNLIFKELRNLGILQKLKDLKVKLENQEMSLENLRESFNEVVEYKGFKIEHFPYTMEFNGKEEVIDGYIIKSTYYIGSGDNKYYLPLYCEDEDGREVNFHSLNDAKEWIDKYKDRYTIKIMHGDEVHAVVNDLEEDV